MKKLIYSFVAIAFILTASAGATCVFSSSDVPQGHPILPPVKEA
ncbi:Uncharacterised protein [Mycobacteroides abscessus subsp. abscessus]|nr:Uncharacterised protein [Mycobacteroides abscessus subsp. abscessus]